MSRLLAASVTLPTSTIPIFRTVASLREWRRKAYLEQKSVGFVATMGALHDGHISLLKHSLSRNDLTVLSIFVNPAQFAPTEDLSTYPRTLEADLALLEQTKVPEPSTESERITSAIFMPTVQDMYPSGITQDVSGQKGTFIEVKGYGHQMEGGSRPGFFRGVATVVTKLFNAVEPTDTYFGQKDIQQGLLLRRMCRDLLLSHPEPGHLHIMPTVRSPVDGLALSSRNAYLSPNDRKHASSLYATLNVCKDAWRDLRDKNLAIEKALAYLKERSSAAEADGVLIKPDYIHMNDPDTFDDVQTYEEGKAVILSGAMWVGKTRLIDNIILGNAEGILG
ncbi:Pantoate-beta-alanine ligase [Sistotremastrum niveocremeum HHB9708]|uniref:Pantoate--beta-alanine ligase n=1 Tax=Sistotremastrum niveocremeum HHB9708 TaxID=1314777 RepID=A0A164W1U9_9AGAM|nr:Pantoate-beta-alanine ligase [Sistotremastrum niveocremeum HHB9708]